MIDLLALGQRVGHAVSVLNASHFECPGVFVREYLKLERYRREKKESQIEAVKKS